MVHNQYDNDHHQLQQHPVRDTQNIDPTMLVMQQQQNQQNFPPQHKTPVNPRFSYNSQNIPSLGQQPQSNNAIDQSAVQHPQQQLQPTQQRQVTAYPANKMNMNGVRSP